MGRRPATFQQPPVAPFRTSSFGRSAIGADLPVTLEPFATLPFVCLALAFQGPDLTVFTASPGRNRPGVGLGARLQIEAGWRPFSLAHPASVLSIFALE